MPKHLSPQPHVGSLAVPRHELQLHLAALAWLDVQAPGGREHVALPSDLFLLTVYGDDTLFCGQAGEEPGLQVVVSVLRPRALNTACRWTG
jgi:hypothetical protein